MSSNRPNLTRPDPTPPHLTLDEQSFQDLLSAAFIIQEHNDRRKQAQPAPVELEAQAEAEADTVCPQCGAPKPAGDGRCPNCHADELRPGERMQRNWASMWLMSQEQGLWPERSTEIRDGARQDVPRREAERRPLDPSMESASSGLLAPLVAREIARRTPAPLEIAQAQTKTEAVRQHALDTLPLDEAPAKGKWTAEANGDVTKEGLVKDDLAGEDWPRRYPTREDSDLSVQAFRLSAKDDSFPAEATIDAMGDATADTTTDASNEAPDLTAPTSDDTSRSLFHRFADLRVTLRFHRADVYLGAAVCIAVLAVLWPAATAPRRPALGTWERALIMLGIAEAPVSAVHFYGDPAIEVWVDPHSALYYCPGEEQYGKTADGRLSSQHDAQMDRFEPAGRAACE